jgi:hypothetical protein
LAPLRYAPGTARVDGALAGGLLEACGNVSIFSLCAAASAAAIHLEVTGLDAPRHIDAPWLAAGARIGVRLAMGHGVTLRPHATLFVPLIATSFLVDQSVVWRSPPVAFAIGLDAAYGWAIQ